MIARKFACLLTIAAFACGSSLAATKSNAKSSSPSKQPRKSIKAPNQAQDPREEQARQTAERERLVERIVALKKEIAAGEKSRADSAASLARAERALAAANKKLEQLALRQRDVQQRIADLDSQRSSKEGEVGRRQGDLARTATAILANADRDPLQLYLTGRDPNAVMLDDAYLGYLARAEVAEVDTLRGHVTKLQEQRQHADAENRVLAQEADAQKSARESLVADQGAQRKTLATLSQTLALQRKSASALEADQKRLSRVVEQLQREIDRRATEERARRELARRRADEDAKAQAAAAARKKNGSRRPSPRATEEGPPPTRIESVPDASVVSGDFAQQRGRLRLPVRGPLAARYGTARGEGGGSWKGLFIKTEAGAEVRAVAAGRVVFADYLRGFGNLLIVDHGDQYLSIYGNNETLLKHAGDAVKAGDVVSLSGNSSGDDQTGLYFELRFRGKPFDPMGWVGAR
ncbi:MAG: murein hydrolase activator EnvC family protein [Burkholderiaceae bacterium]